MRVRYAPSFVYNKLLTLFIQWTTTLGRWIVNGKCFIDTEEVAPAGQLMEVALLVTIVNIGSYLVTSTNKVIGVVELMVETDAEGVVVQVLLVPADVGIVDDEVVECTVDVVRNSNQLLVASFLSQLMGIVCQIEEGRSDCAESFVFSNIAETIDRFGGTVDGLTLGGVELHESCG